MSFAHNAYGTLLDHFHRARGLIQDYEDALRLGIKRPRSLESSVSLLIADILALDDEIASLIAHKQDLKEAYIPHTHFEASIACLVWSRKVTVKTVQTLTHMLELHRKDEWSEGERKSVQECVHKVHRLTNKIELFISYGFNIDATYRVVHLFEKNPERFLIEKEKLEVGDVLVYYNAHTFMKKDLIPAIISRVQGSNFTHVSLIVKKEGEKLFCIAADGHRRLTTVMELKQFSYENLYVFRPKLTKAQQREVLAQINAWVSFLQKKPIPFSVAKIRFTLLWGLLFVLTINIFHRLIMIHNPVKSLGYYCSEIIDTIFADAGIYLSPRSDYDSMTSPSEFIGSPHLRFIGVAKGLPQRQIGADPVFYYTELRLIIRYFNKSGRITCIDNEGRVSLSFQNLGYKTSVFTSDPDAVKKLKESSIEASLSDMCSNPLTHVFIEESVLGNLKNDSQRSRFLEHLKKLLRPEGCIIFCCRIKKLGFALDYALPLWTCNRLIRQSGLAIQYDGVFKPSSVHPYDTYYAVLRRK